MKNFFQFLSETQSQASMQAKKLNLKSDGHGGWLDTRGKFVAKTEDGKLKFVDKKDQKKDDSPAKGQSKTQNKSQTQKTKATSQETKPKGSGEGEVTDQGAADGDTLTVAFGRFNPPTVGHGKLLAAAKKASQGGELKIYPSRTQDPKKNPLDPESLMY